MRRQSLGMGLALALLGGLAHGADLSPSDRQALTASLDKGAPRAAETAHQIWTYAEVGYQETKSSALLQGELKKAGFKVEAGVAGMPTAFVASYRTGPGPVIAILAEFDALPGMAQAAVPTRSPIPGQAAGHACGHHVLGAAAVAAAQAVKAWMAANGVQGEIRVYGTPAEEGGSGKVYMVRAGLFDDVAATLHWHPYNENSAAQSVSLANVSGKFRFTGAAAHASVSPWLGRSALDGVEIMNVAVNYMREHAPDGTRIHYVVTDGGQAPNIVPGKAEVYYVIRHPDPEVVHQLLARVQKAAQGAAMATETKVEFELVAGEYSLLPNDTLGRVMDAALREVGGITWNPEEAAFGAAMARQLPAGGAALESVGQVQPYSIGAQSGGSTDVGDVSWVAPTAGVVTAAWVPGTPAHSWQAVAAGGTSMADKAGLVASKTLALTAARLFRDPELLAKAQAEFAEKRGAGFSYRSMVGDRPPPLDYRR